MAEEKVTYESKTYCKMSHPFAYATLTDFGPGKGMIQIHSDWGTYSSFWGAMGNNTKIKEFVLDCGADYIENNLQWQMNYMGCKKLAYGKLTKFMAQCWPELKEIMKCQCNLGGKPNE